jgi:hypothetical protein
VFAHSVPLTFELQPVNFLTRERLAALRSRRLEISINPLRTA